MIKWTIRMMIVCLLWSAAAGASPTAEQVLQKVSAVFQGLNDCTSLVVAKVDAPDVSLPDTKLRFYYKRPNRTKLDVLEGGLFLMPKGEAIQVLLGFGDATSKIRKDSRAEFVKTEPLNHRTHHVLKMTPQAADSPMRCYYLWVDAERHTISQLRLHPREGGEWMIRITHTRVAPYWLPSQTVITIKAAGTDPATLTFTFSHYRINTGLSEAVFRAKS